MGRKAPSPTLSLPADRMWAKIKNHKFMSTKFFPGGHFIYWQIVCLMRALLKMIFLRRIHTDYYTFEGTELLHPGFNSAQDDCVWFKEIQTSKGIFLPRHNDNSPALTPCWLYETRITVQATTSNQLKQNTSGYEQ